MPLRLIFFGFLFVALPRVSLAESEVAIGAILHLTGDQSMQGNALREGIEVAAAEINASGGVVGHKVAVWYEDSRLNPKEAVAAAKKLLSSEKIVAVLNASYLESSANGPVFQKAHVPVITLWDSAPALEAIGDYIFGIGVWAPSTGEASGGFACNNLKAGRAVIINMDNEWSQTAADLFEEKFRECGGRVLDKFALTPDTTDFRTVLLKAQKLNSDVIYTPITDNVNVFYKQIRASKIKAAIITSDIISESHLSLDPESFEGVYQSQPGDPSNHTTQRLITQYARKFGHSPKMLFLTSLGYDGMRLIQQAAVLGGGITPKNIQQGLRKVTAFDGASRDMMSINVRGSSPISERMYIIRNSQFELVK